MKLCKTQVPPRIEEELNYSSEQMAVVIPTKDRPDRIRQLLTSLSDQTARPGRVVIVDGGESVAGVVDSFRDRLNIEYLICQPPGQIRQRKKGLEKVDERTPLVALFDDDVLVEKDAIEKMIAFWNKAPAHTGGVGFNLVNVPPHRYSRLRALLGMSGKPGQVLSSGYNISIVNQKEDIQVQWLAGGYTVFRLAALREFPQTELKTRWAAGEDVRLSYPIGKKYPLFVCAAARVHDTGQATQLPSPDRSRFQGHKESLAYLYLVEQHPELSKFRCLLMVSASAVLLFIKAIATRSRSVHRAFGHVLGLVDFSKAQLMGKSLKSALED